VPSERVFSEAGELVAARSNIKPKNADMIIFLNKNILCFGLVHLLSLEGGGAVLYGIIRYRISIPC